MIGPTRLSRRKFFVRGLQLAGGSMAAAMIIPSHVLARDGQPGANDRITVGYIGAGRGRKSVDESASEGAALWRPPILTCLGPKLSRQNIPAEHIRIIASSWTQTI